MKATRWDLATIAGGLAGALALPFLLTAIDRLNASLAFARIGVRDDR